MAVLASPSGLERAGAGSRRQRVAGYLWLASLDLWLLPVIGNARHSGQGGDYSFAPGWARPVAELLLVVSLLATVGWGAELGFHRSSRWRRWSLLTGSAVLAVLPGLFLLALLLSSRPAAATDFTAGLVIALVVAVLELAASVVLFLLGWRLGTMRRAGRATAASGLGPVSD